MRTDWEVISMLYLHNNSCAEIAAIVGSYKDTIWLGLKRHGIKMRSMPEAIALAQSVNASTNPRSLRARTRRKVERHLGRKLDYWEDVHHKDENLLHMSMENLQVLAKDKHTRLHHPARNCEVLGCENPHYGNGLCSLHYGRKRRGVPLLDAPKTVRDCSIVGCTREHKAKGLCKFHYQRKSRGIDLNNPRIYWKDYLHG